MDNRIITYLTIAVAAVMGLLLVVNVFPVFVKPVGEKYLAYNDVRGMAVEYGGKLYTLNFDQQKNAIGFFNQSTPLTTSPSLDKPDFGKIIIYRFSPLTDITIKPSGYDQNQNLIFSAAEWSNENSLQENSHGEFKKLISQTHQ